jgi:hypothetical protein
MADEISLTVQFNYANGSAKVLVNPGAIKRDQAAVGLWAPIVTVAATEEDLLPVDISTLGYIVLLNLDPTNFVTYGAKDTTMKALGRLEAGDIAVLRLEPGITLRWIADTAPVQVQVWLFED